MEDVLCLLRHLVPNTYARALRRLSHVSVRPAGSLTHPVTLTRRTQTPPTCRHPLPGQPAPAGQPPRRRSPRTVSGPHLRTGHAPQAGSPVRDASSLARLAGCHSAEDIPATQRVTSDPRARVAIYQGKFVLMQETPCRPGYRRLEELGSPGRNLFLDGSPRPGPQTAVCVTSTVSC